MSYKLDDTTTCRMCGATIRYTGSEWEHLGELQPRHPAWPVEIEWVDGSSGNITHWYSLIRYNDFPYTLIVSNRMTTLIAGHEVHTPGVVVARDLFFIFGEEIPITLESFKQEAHVLAVRWLDIAFNHSHELRGK